MRKIICSLMIGLCFISARPFESFAIEKQNHFAQSISRHVWIYIEDMETNTSEVFAGVVINSKMVMTSVSLAPLLFQIIHYYGSTGYRFSVLAKNRDYFYFLNLQYIDSEVVIFSLIPEEGKENSLLTPEDAPLILSSKNSLESEQQLIGIIRTPPEDFIKIVAVVKNTESDWLKVRYYGMGLLTPNNLRINDILEELQRMTFWTLSGEFVGFARIEELNFVYFNRNVEGFGDMFFYVFIAPIYSIPISDDEIE